MREHNSGAVDMATKLAGTAVEMMPIVGSARYGKGIGGPIRDVLEETTDMFSGQPLAYRPFKRGDTAAIAAGRLYGSPVSRLLGAPASGQIGKFVQGQSRGASPWMSLTGFYEGPPQRGQAEMRGALTRPGEGIRRLR